MEVKREVRRAVILAAGRGARLGGLTAVLPKPMVRLCGKPALECILENLAKVGLLDCLLVVGYRGEAIINHFGDGAQWGMCINYAWQHHANGTGAALRLSQEFAGSEPILASFGDILNEQAHYRQLIDRFTRNSSATIIGINPLTDPTAGAAVYREGERLLRVVEKPPSGTSLSHWNLAGVSVYSSAIWTALASLKPSVRGEFEITDAISALISSGEDVRTCELRGFWSDIGTPETLSEAEQKMMKRGGHC